MATDMNFFSDLFSWRRPTSVQKLILIGICLFTFSIISGFWLLSVVYILMLPVSWKLNNAILERCLFAPSDKLLLGLQAVGRIQHSLLSLKKSEKASKERPSSRPTSYHDSDDDMDIGLAKHVSTLKGQTIEGEVQIFVKYVVRDFLQSWYEDFSHDTQTLKESQQLLCDLADNLTKRGRKISPQRLTVDLIQLFVQHLHTFQMVKQVFQRQHGISLSDHSMWTQSETVEEIFSKNVKFHPALDSNDTEMNFLRSMAKLMLTNISSGELVGCKSAHVMVTEILACNVLKTAVDMLTNTEWLYESMIILFSDDDAMTCVGQSDNFKELSDEPEYTDSRFIKQVTEASLTENMETEMNVNESTNRKNSATEQSMNFADRTYCGKSLLAGNAPNIPEIHLEYFDVDDCDIDEKTYARGDGSDSNHGNSIPPIQSECDNDDVPEKTHDLSENNAESNSKYSEQSRDHDLNTCSKTKPITDDIQKVPKSDDSVQETKSNKSIFNTGFPFNHATKQPTSSSSCDIQKRTTTSTLFNLFTRRKDWRSNSAGSSSSDPSEAQRVGDLILDDEVTVVDSSQVDTEPSLGVECSEEASPMKGDDVVRFFIMDDDKEEDIMCDDSSLLFQDISIPQTEERQEYRSSSKYTLYSVEYNALYLSDGPPVFRSGSVKRRFREFVNLQARLEDQGAYKKLLRDVKGPSRWNTLPFKNMDKDSIETRRVFLDKYMKALIHIEAICNGPEIREFLAYEGDGHIAFVRRATEISVPRLDKMFVRTVSGVFDKLKSIPDIPQNVISAVTKRDRSMERLDVAKETEDTDNLEVEYSWQEAEDSVSAQWLQTVEDILSSCEKYMEEKEEEEEEEEGEDTVAMTTSLDKKGAELLLEEIHAQLPRLQGDGSEDPETLVKEGIQVLNDLPLANSVLELVVQAIKGHKHWLTHERMLLMTRILTGRALDRWLSDKITYLTSPERWVYYSQLLREAIWPHGELKSGDKAIKTQIEKEATRRKAKQCLKDFFPSVLERLAGSDEYDNAADLIVESLSCEKLNRHFLYVFLEILMEKLFPEITAEDLQGQLLS